MTDREHMAGSGHHEGDAAAYALGALDPTEAETFARHLETCTICREKLRVYQEVTDALPTVVPQYNVPKALRRRVLREVRAEGRARQGSRRHRPHLGWSLSMPRLGAALVAAAAVVIAVVVASASGGGAPRVIQASVTAPASSAELRLSGSRGELIVRHMPPPRARHIYELWLQRGNRAPSPTSALFSVTSNGSADIGVPGSLADVRAVMVTQERAGGSKVPTSAPVIVARIS